MLNLVQHLNLDGELGTGAEIEDKIETRSNDGHGSVDLVDDISSRLI